MSSRQAGPPQNNSEQEQPYCLATNDCCESRITYKDGLLGPTHIQDIMIPFLNSPCSTAQSLAPAKISVYQAQVPVDDPIYGHGYLLYLFPEFQNFYKLQCKLGSGAFSLVYSCHDANNQVFAVKIPANTRSSIYSSIRERMFLEALSPHRNIIQLRHIFLAGVGGSVLVFDHAANGSLSDFMRVETYHSLSMARPFFIQLVHGLQYLHSSFIIHCDLKPDNILVCVEVEDDIPRIVISDFGNSAYLTDDGTIDSCSGTPCTAAPEVGLPYFPKHRHAPLLCGRACDIWSLGCVLYLLLTRGIHPFNKHRTDLTHSMKAQIQSGWYTWPSPEVLLEHGIIHQIPKSAKWLVHEMLSLDPLKRISLSKCLIHGWVKGITGIEENEISDPPPRTPETMPPRWWEGISEEEQLEAAFNLYEA